MDAGLGCFADNAVRNGNNYQITNNVIYNCRGRGAVLRGAYGTLAGNSIGQMCFPAVMIAPEFGSREAGFPENTVVRISHALQPTVGVSITRTQY